MLCANKSSFLQYRCCQTYTSNARRPKIERHLMYAVKIFHILVVTVNFFTFQRSSKQSAQKPHKSLRAKISHFLKQIVDTPSLFRPPVMVKYLETRDSRSRLKRRQIVQNCQKTKNLPANQKMSNYLCEQLAFKSRERILRSLSSGCGKFQPVGSRDSCATNPDGFEI